MLTLNRLKEVLNYNPDTGIFIFKVCSSNGKQKTGSVAGNVYRTNNRRAEYLRIWIDGKRYYSHRLAWLYMYGEWPNNGIDHINGDGIDNRIENIREADNTIQQRNRAQRSDNRSGVTGVFWYKNLNKWCADIKVKGKKIFLGYFDNLDDAAAVRKSAELRYGFHANHGRRR